MELAAGRTLLALLFVAGAIQKVIDPGAAQDLLSGFGLPRWMVWPAMMFNAAAGLCLLLNVYVISSARALAIYCVATSAFHFLPDDPWQVSIFVKNWTIAGGLLVLAAAAEMQKKRTGALPGG